MRSRHEKVPTPWSREDTKRGPQADPRDESAKFNSRVFSQAAENKWQGAVTELLPCQKKGETADGLCVGSVGVLTTSENSDSADRKKNWRQAYRLHWTSNIKKAGLHCPL